MWFYFSVIFLLVEELRLPKLESRYTSRRGIAATILQVLVMSLCQTFQKMSYFNKKIGLLVFLLFNIQKCCWYSLKFYNDFHYIVFKILFIGFIFFIVIVQAIFVALCLNPFNRFLSIMNQIESSSASVTTWGRCFLDYSLMVVLAV